MTFWLYPNFRQRWSYVWFDATYVCLVFCLPDLRACALVYEIKTNASRLIHINFRCVIFMFWTWKQKHVDPVASHLSTVFNCTIESRTLTFQKNFIFAQYLLNTYCSLSHELKATIQWNLGKYFSLKIMQKMRQKV